MSGTYLAKIRTKHGYTQAEFAEKLGFSQRTIATWEQGRAKPRPEAIRAIRVFLSEVTDDKSVLNEIADKIIDELMGEQA